MNDLQDFFITEEFPDASGVEVDIHETAAGLVVLPTKTGKHSRRPIDPGFVLGWTEWHVSDPDVRWRRRGMVMAWAPNQASVWVIPDEQRDGEGTHVVVRGVTADESAEKVEPHRVVGGPGDYRSTPQWQSPRTLLPRPWLRVDRVYSTAGGAYDNAWLHAQAECTFLVPDGSGSRAERGETRRVEDCYLFEGALHPMSARPTTRSGDWVPLCPRCMKAKLPT